MYYLCSKNKGGNRAAYCAFAFAKRRFSHDAACLEQNTYTICLEQNTYTIMKNKYFLVCFALKHY